MVEKKSSGKGCQSCCKIIELSKLYWVIHDTHKSLHCIDCIEIEKLVIDEPYSKPRKKKSI